MNKNKTVLITGCSSGFGLLITKKFAEKGWNTVATVRDLSSKAEDINLLKSKYKNIDLIKIDITNQFDIELAFTHIKDKYGSLDILVNNAGVGYIGPVEDLSIEEIKAQHEVNFFGPIRMIHKFLPLLRDSKNKPKIINISSMMGQISFPLYGGYASSKFALEAVSESLSIELIKDNIQVSLIQPGIFLTKFEDSIIFAKKYKSDETKYKDLIIPFEKASIKKLRKLSIIPKIFNPEKVANKVFKLANKRSIKLRYRVGFDTHLYYWIRILFGERIFKAIIRKGYDW